MARLWTLPFLSVAALAVACATAPDCEDACVAYWECLTRSAQDRGVSAVAAEQDRDRVLAACLEACGGGFGPLSDVGAALLAEGGPALVPLLPTAPEPVCAALAAGPARCSAVESAETRADCEFFAVTVDALRERVPAKCAVLPDAFGRACLALAGEGVGCDALRPVERGVCEEVRSGDARQDKAVLALAVRDGRADLCTSIRDDWHRAACRAAVTRDEGACPRELRPEPADFAAFGARVRSGTTTQETPSAPTFLPALYAVLAVFAGLFWLIVAGWTALTFRDAWRESRGSCLLLAAVGLAGLLLRLVVARQGPINFVEYERIFVPPPDDLGRLAYAGQALVLAPLARLLSPSFELIFSVNAVLSALAAVAVFPLARSAGLDRRWAVFGVALVALNPVCIRVGATGSETAGFSFLALLCLDLVATRGVRRAALLPLLLPLLLSMAAVWRPEGIFLAVPLAVTVVLALRAGRSPGATRPAEARAGAAWWVALSLCALELAFFAVLFLQAPAPEVVWPLLLDGASSLVLDLAHPGRFSVLLVVAWGAGCLTGRGAVASALFVPVLFALWIVQGTEGNVAFGSARYLAVAVPWMALAAAAGVARLAPKWRLPAAALLLLSFAPQAGLVRLDSNMQKEFRFVQAAVRAVPEHALVVLPARPAADEQVKPEAAMLAALGMAGRDTSWMSAAQMSAAVAREAAAPRSFFVVSTFYRDDQAAAVLQSHCALITVLEENVESEPDVAWYKNPERGAPVLLSLFHVTCPGPVRMEAD